MEKRRQSDYLEREWVKLQAKAGQLFNNITDIIILI